MIMAQLLGSKYCIESLLRDIKDIQETVSDINSRVGQVKYQSWKYPDKMSVEVNVEELLDGCKFNEDDEEHNQMSHVMLYDLLIDRLLFLLQCFTHFNEILLSADSNTEYTRNLNRSTNKSLKSLSAGLTTKKCWSRLSQVATAMQQLAKVIQNNNFKKEISVSKSQKFSSDERLPLEKHVTAPGVSEYTVPISEDLLNRSCQTDETAYVSCEICCRTQACLFEVGRSIVKVCKSQALPTSLEDYISRQSEASTLSIAELSRWKHLQTKDLSRIDRHLENLLKQVIPLKKDLAAAKKSENDSKSEAERINMFHERKIIEVKEEFRIKEHKTKEMEKALQEKVSALTRENTKFQEAIALLNVQLSDIKDELLQKHRSFIATENEKVQLREEALEGKQYQNDAMRLQGERAELCRKLQSAEDRLQSTSVELEKERNRSRTMQSHEQAMQEKQRGILQRFDEINEECEELRERIALAEEDRDKMEADVKLEREKSRQEIQQLKNQQAITNETRLERRVSDLQANVLELEQQLADCVQRERLLVSYPDLHKSHNLQVIENSGDVFTDMKRQVKANQIRIEVLEKENANLMRTLAKMTSSIPNSGDSPPSFKHQQENGVQLWKSSDRSMAGRPTPSPTSDVDLKFLGLDDSDQQQVYSRGSPEKSSTHNKRQHHRPRDSRNKSSDHIQISPTRSSFSVGPGKRRTNTPSSSRPSSGRSALLKPWT